MLSLFSRVARPGRPARVPARRPVSRAAVAARDASLVGWADSSLELLRGVDVVEVGGEPGAALLRELFGAARGAG